MSDTDRKARDIQFRLHCQMTGEQRLTTALEMSEFGHELARRRIVEEHPDWATDLVSRELLRLAFLPEELPARLA